MAAGVISVIASAMVSSIAAAVIACEFRSARRTQTAAAVIAPSEVRGTGAQLQIHAEFST